MSLMLFGSLAGGLGLFLLGMRLMTDGLKFAAGSSLSRILENSTKTPLLGICSGAFLTSLVQSSSAVTVGTIGFVNAGLMDLKGAIALIYGSNLGTTITGWLVSLIGFQLNVKAVALPAIGIGMLLRVISREGRQAAMGDVLAGFGIFFMGIDVLKASFDTVSQDFHLASYTSSGMANVLLFIAIGFLLTLLMQSSSASIAMVLTAAAGKVLPLPDAAAMVIGANIGTTSTAALAVIGATPNAKRLAGAHVIFNLITGFAAFLLLPVLLSFLTRVQEYVTGSNAPATLLAMFHTTFNILGILLLYPLTNLLVSFLNKRFRTAEEDEARPQFLDSNVVSTPVLALHALENELVRLGAIARRMANGAISSETGPSQRLTNDKAVVMRLVDEIAGFGMELQRKTLPPELDNQLPNALRVSGYYNDVAELAVEAAELQPKLGLPEIMPELAADLAQFKSHTVKLLALTDTEAAGFSLPDSIAALEILKDEYRALKARLLKETTRDQISVHQMVRYLDFIARIRRIAEQAEKAARYLTGLHLTEEELRGQTSDRVEK